MFAKPWALLCRLVLLASMLAVIGGVVAVSLRFPLAGGVLLLGLAVRSLGRRRVVSDNYGSATMTDAAKLPATWFTGNGPIIGRAVALKPSKAAALKALLNVTLASDIAVRTMLAGFLHRGWLSGRLLRLNTFTHIGTFSPAGGGKGVAVLVPNLKSYIGSCVVVDPKGELAKLTADFRRKRFSHKIIVIDPFGVSGRKSDTLNPLDFIDETAPDFIDRCRDLASTIVIRSGKEHDSHWNDSCELVLLSMICFVCAWEKDRSKRNFKTVRGILTNPAGYAKAKEVMQQLPGFDGVLASLGGSISWYRDREEGSVMTTVMRHTAFMDSPLVAANLAASSFDPMILRKKRVTLYLVLPHDKLVSLAALQRLWIGTIMRRITSGPPTEKNPVLWLLDEMAHIGKVPAIEDAFTLLRGMGMRLWVFFQSREQLKTCFGDHAGTVLDNIGTQQYFNITSYETAKELSDRIGETTIAVETDSDSTSYSRPVGGSGANGDQPGNRSSSRTRNRSEMARKLWAPNEILTSRDTAFVFHQNMPVLVCDLVKHFSAPEFKYGGTGRNPGLGLCGGIASAVILAASLALAGVALAIANTPMQPATPVYSPARGPAYRPGRFNPGFRPGTYPGKGLDDMLNRKD